MVSMIEVIKNVRSGTGAVCTLYKWVGGAAPSQCQKLVIPVDS